MSSSKHEIALVLRAQRGDKAALALVMERGEPWIRTTLGQLRMHRQYAQTDDFLQEGRLGLMKAIERWRPDGGNSFKTHAILYIRQYIVGFSRRISSEHSPDTVDVKEISDSKHPFYDSMPEVDIELTFLQCRPVIDKILSFYPEKQRTVIRLMYGFDNLPEIQASDLARILGVSKGRLSHIKKAIFTDLHNEICIELSIHKDNIL